MSVRYELRVTAICPVDKSVIDIYDVVIEAADMVPVEQINAFFKLQTAPIYQEALTSNAAEALATDDNPVTVTTIGYHSGVKTVCTMMGPP